MDFKTYEKKWQTIWEQEKRFEVNNHEEGKKNAYVLIEFPYPSGKGLHTGHGHDRELTFQLPADLFGQVLYIFRNFIECVFTVPATAADTDDIAAFGRHIGSGNAFGPL